MPRRVIPQILVVLASLVAVPPLGAQPRPGTLPRGPVLPGPDAVTRALSDVSSFRRAFVVAAFRGDRHGMAAADSGREAAIRVMAQAPPRLASALPWPLRTAWFELALRERRPDWSRSLLRENPLPPPEGTAERGPFALAQGLTALRLLESDPEDEDASIGDVSLLEVAQTAFRTAAGERFLLQDEAFYHLWYLAEGEGDTVDALAWADSLAIRHPRSLRTPWIRLTRARGMFAAGEPGAAETEARLAIPAADGPEVRWFLIRCSLAMDFPRKACRELQHLITTYGETPLALAAWERRLALARADSTLGIPLLERIGLLVSLLPNPDSGARDSLGAMIDDPDLPQEARSRAAISLCRFLYRAKQYSRAEPLLQRLLADPDDAVAEEARIMLARILRNTGRLDAMADHYEAVLDEDGSLASRALWEWAREEESQNAWKEAETLFSRYVARFPDTPHYRDALFRRGFDRTRRGKLRDAVEDFRAALRASRSPSQDEQAAFWLARTLTELGHEKQAQEAARAGAHPEPADGYGVLLRERFPDAFSPGEADTEDIPDAGMLFDAIDPGEWPEPVAYHYLRGLDLVELGQADAARREWGRAADLGRRYPSLLQSLALMAAAYNLYPEGVRWANQGAHLLPRGHRHRLGYERLAYPAAYYRFVVGEADKVGVNPWSVWALMRQESFYAPDAVSRAGALGLMQVMPATLERIINESGMPPLPADALLIPRVNITLGTQFFSDRLNEFSGRLLPTLASYNAGEGKSWEWLRRADGDSEEVFIETIGYPETYDYVRRILWLTWVYEAYYGTDSKSSSNGPRAR